jgi:hypothetical protein
VGADYYLYTEVKQDDGWHVLNGRYYNVSKNRLEMAETYYSGSRTYFSRTYDKLRDIGTIIKTNELSPEVLEKEDWLDENDRVVSVSINELRQSIPKTSRHQCCGYVHKSQIWNYEIENGEIDEYLSAEEYDELSDAEKNEYEFYEWNDPMDWYLHFKEIVSIVNFQIGEYMRVNHLWHEPTNIRLICIASY